MSVVIDVKGELLCQERVGEAIESWGQVPGYVRVFGARYASLITGRPRAEFTPFEALPDHEMVAAWRSAIEAADILSVAGAVAQLRMAGVRCVCLHAVQPVKAERWDYRASNERLGTLVRRHPDFILGFANVDIFDGTRAVEEVERCVRELGFVGLKVTPVFFNVTTDDPRLLPLYRKCEELDIVLWLHCGNGWNAEAPMDLTHPVRLDRVACQFPRLRIIAGHAGWPWVLDAVVAAWRHGNVYLDISAHRPRYLATPHSGWEPLLHFGNSTVRDKVLFGSAWDVLGMRLSELVDEVRGLPLRPEVIELWLHGNAERCLRLGPPSSGGDRDA